MLDEQGSAPESNPFRRNEQRVDLATVHHEKTERSSPGLAQDPRIQIGEIQRSYLGRERTKTLIA